MREAQCTSLEETNWNPSLERESGKCSSQSRAKKGKEGRGSVCSNQHSYSFTCGFSRWRKGRVDPGRQGCEHRKLRCVGDDANPMGVEGACHRSGGWSSEGGRGTGAQMPAVGPLETPCKGPWDQKGQRKKLRCSSWWLASPGLDSGFGMSPCH